MANQFNVQMSARAQGWRDSYDHNRAEVNRLLHYAVYAVVALALVRGIIELTRHFTVLMPVGIVAAILFSAGELAIGAAAVILALVAVGALVILPAATLVRVLLRR